MTAVSSAGALVVPPPGWAGVGHSAKRLLPLAWPVFVGQVAMLSYSTVDTLLMGRYGAQDLAALAVGAAAYLSIFIGLMGVVLALSPTVGRLYGAGELHAAGEQVHQTVWLAIALGVVGSALLVFPAPFLWMAGAGPEVETRVRGYLLALALSLPASLMLVVYRSFNNAVSRPKAVMVLQLLALAVKVPLSTVLAFGWPAVGLPALGVTGCGLATAVAMWVQCLLAAWWLKRDPFYAQFALFGRGLDRPRRADILALLRHGVPMGATVLVEVTGFAFMAFFMARLGTATVAGHQIVANLCGLLFMSSLALANATTTLVAQRLGARDQADAVRLGWHGGAIACLLALGLGLLATALSQPITRLYTGDAQVAAAALPLMVWVAAFHLGDAAQTVANLVLRAWHVTTWPLVLYVVSLWGLGLGGGYLLAQGLWAGQPDWLSGASAYRAASTVSLWVVSVALWALVAWVVRNKQEPASTA